MTMAAMQARFPPAPVSPSPSYSLMTDQVKLKYLIRPIKLRGMAGRRPSKALKSASIPRTASNVIQVRASMRGHQEHGVRLSLRHAVTEGV